jgi:beta-glucosidase
MENPAIEDTFSLNSRDFGKDFAWGVASSAYQVEGAYRRHGKGPSIWDTFTARKGTTFQGHHGQIACDFYHRYREDLQLMQAMNLANFRFSISWPRLLPKGRGAVSEKGLDFYDRLLDTCLEKGITPWVTLYHWDLPQALQDKGGWGNRDIVSWFSDYTALCARHYGDRVKHWMVLNEPMVFTGAGYFLGVHAPGEKGLKKFLPAVHHAVLSQAAGGRVLRSECPQAEIGTTFSCSHITPRGPGKLDQQAADRADALLNRLFLEPALGLGYPAGTLGVLKRLEPYVKANDMKDAGFDFDFIGLQNYTREVVAHSYFVPYLSARIIKATKRNVPTTLMDWEVNPRGMYYMIRKFSAYSGIRKIIISENGAAFKDDLCKGKVHDPRRLSYLQEYLQEVHLAMKEGSPVGGYFVWTFTDNFEWAEGYYPRFGLVYTDFPTQKRILKSSGQWYARFIGQQAEDFTGRGSMKELQR